MHKALDILKDQVFIPSAGDRPNAPNLCIFFTTRGLGYKARRKLSNTCHRIIVLRKGVVGDLDRIRDRVCPEADYLAGMNYLVNLLTKS